MVCRPTGQKTGALSTIGSQEKERLKAEAKRTGSDYVELPGKVVWTIKPDKYKCRAVACGNQTDLDTSMLWCILSWAAASSQNAVASLDITAAFLNAELLAGRTVILRPPSILYKTWLTATWVLLEEPSMA